MRTDQSEEEEPRFRFERPLEIMVMSIDGTYRSNGLLFEISDSRAEIELSSHAAELSEFFLMLTNFGDPVFRRCKREWVRGLQVGVSFNNSNIGLKSSRDAPQEQSRTR